MKLFILFTTAMAIVSVHGQYRNNDFSMYDGAATLSNQIEILKKKISYVYGKQSLTAMEANTMNLYGQAKLEAYGKTYNALKEATEEKMRNLFADPQELLRTLASDPNAAVTMVNQVKTIIIDLYYDLLKLMDEHDVNQIPQYFYERIMEKLIEFSKKARNLRSMVNEDQLGDAAKSAGLGDVITKDKLHKTLETVDAFSLENFKPIIDTFVPNIAHHLAPLFNKDLMEAFLRGLNDMCETLIERKLITKFFNEILSNNDLQALRQTVESVDMANPSLNTIVGTFFSLKEGVNKAASSISEMPIIETIRVVFDDSMSDVVAILTTVTDNVMDDIKSNSSFQLLQNLMPSAFSFLEGFTAEEESAEEEQLEDEYAGAVDTYNMSPYHHGYYNQHYGYPQQHYYSGYNPY